MPPDSGMAFVVVQHLDPSHASILTEILQRSTAMPVVEAQQASNEELVTVNAELQTKIEQMASLQDDMKNLLGNIRVGKSFLDRHQLIRRLTRDAAQIYRLASTDVGRPLADIRSALQGDDLLPDAQTALDSLVPIEREVCTADGTWYLARIQPYRTVDNLIDGVDLRRRDRAGAGGRHAQGARSGRGHRRHGAAPAHRAGRDAARDLRQPFYYRDFGGTRADTVLERRVLEHDFGHRGAQRVNLSAHRIVDQVSPMALVLLSIEPVEEHAR